VIKGCDITKETRQEQFGKVAGGAGSTRPEQFQRTMIEKGTGIPCPKTHMRINFRTRTLEYMMHPNKKVNGFDYSEDFDGLQEIGSKKIYLNLKCIVGAGGSQTRSLREVYLFMRGQIDTLTDDLYYANILDGDEAHASMDKFEFLLHVEGEEDIRQKIYVGDLAGYFTWFSSVKGSP